MDSDFTEPLLAKDDPSADITVSHIYKVTNRDLMYPPF